MSFGSAKPRTKAQDARMDAIKWGPCLCCLIRNIRSFCPEVHHLLEGGRRRGHDYTIGLCSYHHRGAVGEWDLSTQQMRAMFGPSLAHGSKPFREAFADDDALLAMQNHLLDPEGYP